MKKKTLLTTLALACVLSLAACGSESPASQSTPASTQTSVKEETSTSASVEEKKEEVTSVSTETPASTESSASESQGEFDINGIWLRDKYVDTWIVIRNMGQEWSLYDSMGEEAVKGTVALSGDNFALYDEKGDTYMEVGLIGTDGLMDMMYQETYTKVDSLPDKFPGQLAKEVGFGSIEGDWFYQQSTRENTADYKTVAYVSVLSDGNYEIRWLEDLSEATGTIMPVETENPDGTKGIAYIFYEGGNNLWQVIDAPDTAEAEEIAIDQEGLERFLRNYGEGD